MSFWLPLPPLAHRGRAHFRLPPLLSGRIKPPSPSQSVSSGSRGQCPPTACPPCSIPCSLGQHSPLQVSSLPSSSSKPLVLPTARPRTWAVITSMSLSIGGQTSAEFPPSLPPPSPLPLCLIRPSCVLLPATCDSSASSPLQRLPNPLFRRAAGSIDLCIRATARAAAMCLNGLAKALGSRGRGSSCTGLQERGSRTSPRPSRPRRNLRSSASPRLTLSPSGWARARSS